MGLGFHLLMTILIDARDHILGRLASIVAKKLLSGHHMVVVRCDEMLISGGLSRQKMKFERFLHKSHNSNPRRCGPIHYRAPARIFWRVVRGMVPHKTARGTAALARLDCFEGIPFPYDKAKRMVAPDALKVLRKAQGGSIVKLGVLSSSVGWKHATNIKELEDKRKERSAEYFVAKKMLTSLHYQKNAHLQA